MVLLRMSSPSSRTNPIVVDSSERAAPLSRSPNASSFGTSSGLAFTTRCGRNPPSFLRKPSRYFVSRLSGAGRKNGVSAISSSLTGMPNRARNSRSSFSLSFFCWCVMLRPSPASPSP